MDCQQADCDEKCSCQKNLPEGQLVIRVRIESRQPGGPEHLPNVGNATDSRVVQSPCEWQLVDRSCTVELCQQCHHGRKSRQRKQRNLFRYQAAHLWPLTTGGCFPLRALCTGGIVDST